MKSLAYIPAIVVLTACGSAAARPPAATVAAAPPCEAQVEPKTGDIGPMAGFGCATQSNLQAMAVDPRDLVVGRPITPAHGDAAFAAVRRYTADALKLVITKDSPVVPTLERVQAASQ